MKSSCQALTPKSQKDSIQEDGPSSKVLNLKGTLEERINSLYDFIQSHDSADLKINY